MTETILQNVLVIMLLWGLVVLLTPRKRVDDLDEDGYDGV